MENNNKSFLGNALARKEKREKSYSSSLIRSWLPLNLIVQTSHELEILLLYCMYMYVLYTVVQREIRASMPSEHRVIA